MLLFTKRNDQSQLMNKEYFTTKKMQIWRYWWWNWCWQLPSMPFLPFSPSIIPKFIFQPSDCFSHFVHINCYLDAVLRCMLTSLGPSGGTIELNPNRYHPELIKLILLKFHSSSWFCLYQNWLIITTILPPQPSWPTSKKLTLASRFPAQRPCPHRYIDQSFNQFH